jgi:glycosyltransferase involved in cell wall biosynthesis
MQISATIVAFNEERNIARVIESLRCCDEILVVDSGSNDRTVEIASKLGARVVEASWHGYAAQKNIAAELAAHDWILSLDADESLSEALEAEIWQIKKAGPAFDGYTMPRLAQYLGRWILHSGWYPDRKVRLFNRRKAKWVGEFVHESVKVEGSVGHLESNLLHFTCDSLSQHLRSMDTYTTLAAQELVTRGKSFGYARLLLDPPWTFFRTYFLKLGFLDGVEGLTIAYMAALYNFVKYTKSRHMSPGRKI